ncbi:MAG: hypothetical protein A2992_06775 [Elusimicrobia bacterium RIFCSPLOWO2_01_FULL_59_12]|nr:MAG: hypothetical protein A2992_06775 [Elusimicrobia bacterium RIFCSPLOWO2_01_FULL_59_12]
MNQPKLEVRLCKLCGQPYESRVSDLARGYGHYCSQACRNRARAKKFHSHPVPAHSHPVQGAARHE